MDDSLKTYVVSLGCPKNLTYTEHILALIKGATNSFFITNNIDEANIILINTCAFIEDAVSESVECILELSQNKKEDQKIIVFGCLPLRYASKLESVLPEVDKFVFHVEPFDVANEIAAYIGVKTHIENHEHKRIFTGHPWHTYVKISDGCSNRCTYCLIPKIRGPLRCRKPTSIIDEINLAVENGAIEVTLVAQDLTSYRVEDFDLVKLIEKILAETAVSWLRLMYLYPDGISKPLLELIAKESRICNYLDVPIQHASDKILKRMGRKNSLSQLEKTMETIRKYLPEASLRTTVMVGFPGEEEGDFNILKEFIKKWRFHHLGCFVYSDEEDAPSRLLKNKVPEELAEERKSIILEMQKDISLSINRSFIGKELDVLVDGYCEESELLLCSRNMFQAPEIDGTTYITKGFSKAGALETVKITDAFEYDLVGEIVPKKS